MTAHEANHITSIAHDGVVVGGKDVVFGHGLKYDMAWGWLKMLML